MKRFVLLILLLLNSSCHGGEQIDKQAILVGDYLIESAVSEKLFSVNKTGHPNIVRIGDGLKNKLLELRPELAKGCTSELLRKHKDKEASHVVLLVCDKKPTLGLRLSYDGDYKAFHILGYWTSGL
ncbi:hypothetical protein ACFL0R_04500 [Pseudomonadota bacterium]